MPEALRIFCTQSLLSCREIVGCQVAVPGSSILLASPPFAGIVHSEGSPSFVDEKIMLSPSDDHAGGPMIDARCEVTGCGVPPPAGIAKISSGKPAPFARTNAIRVPSGENDGPQSRSCPCGSLRGRTDESLTDTRKICAPPFGE